MKKIATLFTVLCILNFFALAGLVGYLFASGRLDRPKAVAMLDMLRHKGTPDNFREQLYDILEATTATAPASQPALAAGTQPSNEIVAASAEDRIDFARKTMEQERIRLENQAQELRHRQELLVQLQGDVQAKLTKIAADKKVFEDQVAAAANKTQDDSFQKSLALYDELKPKQIKEIFSGMAPDLVAKYLQAMDPARAAKIIGEFKSPPDSQFIATILERMRVAGTAPALGTSTAGNAPVAAPGT